MRTRSWRGLAAAVLVTGMIAAGCGSDEPAAAPPPPPPTRIEGRLAAAADVNPDLDRKPSPILVRLYELKVETAFSNADFFQLHDDDAAVLGADLVARSEHILVPGETVKFSRLPAAEVRFFGAMAAYQAIEAASWRALMPVPPNQTTTLTVAARRLQLVFEDVASVDPSASDKKDRKR